MLTQYEVILVYFLTMLLCCLIALKLYLQISTQYSVTLMQYEVLLNSLGVTSKRNEKTSRD